MRIATRRHLWVWAVGSILLAAAACQEPLQEVPAPLIGVWEPDADGWTGRFLEISSDEVRFGSNAGTADTYEVLGTVREQLESKIGYTVLYQDAEFDQAKLHLIYDPSTGSMSLKHRPHIVWWLQGAERPVAPETTRRAKKSGRVR